MTNEQDQDDIAEVANRYASFAETARLTHYSVADFSASMNNGLGFTVAVTAAIVSSSIFSNVSGNPSFGWTLTAGIISLVAAALSAIQTFYKFSELAEKHRLAGAHFGETQRDIQLFLLGNPQNEPKARAQLARLVGQIGKLEEAGPGYPGWLFRRIDRKRRRKR